MTNGFGSLNTNVRIWNRFSVLTPGTKENILSDKYFWVKKSRFIPKLQILELSKTF